MALRWLFKAPWTWKVLATLLAGSGAGLLVNRLLLNNRLMAVEADHPGRMTSIEISASLQRARVDSLASRVQEVEENTGTLVRAECLRTSKADQQLLRMSCPADLYRGVPR